MKSNSTIIWLSIILLFLLPTPMGRFFIDMAGGLILLILIITLAFGGFMWINFRNIKSKIKTCSNCGTSYFSDLNQCPVCGSSDTLTNEASNNIPASSVTIDINAEKAE